MSVSSLSDGQPVEVQALLPQAGETLLLQGAPGGGTTRAAHLLVRCWTEAATRVVDLGVLQLLLLVDCSSVTGGLFQEIITQRLLKETSTEELRTRLSSSETLLLLDGYREGSQCFDESLRSFLREKGGCRVLVTTCRGHCPALQGAVGAGRVLELQTPMGIY